METEAKYIVPDSETFGRLKEAEQFGPYSNRDARVKQVHDRYVDTADRDFYKHKLFARLREGSDGSKLLTLKSLGSVSSDGAGAIHTRDEYETQVLGLDVAEWPEGEVRSLAEQVASGKPLLDLFAIDQTRTVSHLYANERSIAELSLDEVTIQGQGGPHHDYEVEVELLEEGLLADLRIVSSVLEEQYDLKPQPQSKFERAMSLSGQAEATTAETNTAGEQQQNGRIVGTTVSLVQNEESAPNKAGDGSSDAEGGQPTTDLSGEQPQPPSKQEKPVESKAGSTGNQIGVLPTDSINVAARKMLKVHFQKMLANEEGTRKGGDPEALHDMRVSTRRMRAVLRVLKRYMSGPGLDDVNTGLRDLAHAQGAARDLDVLINNAKDFRYDLPAEQQSDLKDLIDSWEKDRARARKQLIALLDSKEYSRLRKRMQAFLEYQDPDGDFPNASAEVRPNQVRHVAASAIWNRFESVRAFEMVMDAPTIEQLHALRITGKYLRYTLECFAEVLPPDAAGLISDVTRMQDELGELHDAWVAAGLIREHMKKAQKKAKKGSKAVQADANNAADNRTSSNRPNGLTAYLDEREDAIRSIQHDFNETWAVLSSPEWRRRLAAVTGAI